MTQDAAFTSLCFDSISSVEFNDLCLKFGFISCFPERDLTVFRKLELLRDGIMDI